MCFGENNIANLFKDQIQNFPQEIQQQFSKKALTWKNIPSRPSNRSMMDPNDILGEWVHEDEDATVWMTVGTDQTILNFMQLYGMEPAEGGVGISGSAVDSMDYMMLMSIFYGYTILFVSNNPIFFGYGYGYDYEEIDIELPFYSMTYASYGNYGFAEFIGFNIVDGDTIFYEFENDDVGNAVAIDTTTFRVDISALTFASENGDTSFTLNGTLAPGTVDLVAGTPFEMPFLSDDFGPDPNENESLYFQFFEDGTGYEIYDGFYDDYYGYYEYSDTSEFEWSATDDSISLFFSYYDYSGYEESDTISLAYNVANDTLTFEAELDFCEMMGDDYYYYYDSLNCYDMFEEDFGMTDIQDITLDFWMELSYMGPLAIAGEIALQSGQFKLHQAYPNPFNPSTTLKYEMGSAGPVSIDVFDVNGRKIRSLYTGIQTPGQHEVRWDAKNDNGRSMSSGVYLFKVNVNGKMHTAKTLLLK
jgi:hypothetical protein